MNNVKKIYIFIIRNIIIIILLLCCKRKMSNVY